MRFAGDSDVKTLQSRLTASQLLSVLGHAAGVVAPSTGVVHLAASLGATRNRTKGKFHSPYLLARDLCLIGAVAAGVVAIDTIYADIDDLEGLKEEAVAARRDGFLGKMVIHPKHVDVVNAAFTPSEEEVAHAKKIVEAFAQNPTAGVVRIDGKMVDKPHLRAAQKILGLAG